MDRQFDISLERAKQFERLFGWPILFIFLISLVVMLWTQATWVTPVMLVVSMGMAYKGYMEYRVVRHFAEHQAVVQVLRYRLIDCWIRAASLFALFIPLYVNEGAFILTGGVVALWNLTVSYREKKWKQRIELHQPQLLTYSDILEKEKDSWNYRQK